MAQVNTVKQHSCTACRKQIRNTNNSILCSICKQHRHLKCTVFLSVDVDTICTICTNELFPFSQVDSISDFSSTISTRNTDSNIDYDILNNLKLQFKCEFTSTFLTQEEDLDVDANYYNILLNNPIKYYETKNLNQFTPTPVLQTPQFIMHINARSLPKNINTLTTELNLLSNKPSIIAISETWATSDNDNLPIDGYNCILKSRKNKVGGGVALYLQSNIELKYKLRSDLDITDTSESLFIQINNGKQKNIIIGVIYKPPNIDVNKFTDSFEKILKIISKERKPCYLMGDFNINLLKHEVHVPTKTFLDTTLTYGFYPLINKPTRITTHSVTLIDNILTNVHNSQTKSGIWIVDISDHLPIFAILQNSTQKPSLKKKIYKRTFTPQKLNNSKMN